VAVVSKPAAPSEKPARTSRERTRDGGVARCEQGFRPEPQGDEIVLAQNTNVHAAKRAPLHLRQHAVQPADDDRRAGRRHQDGAALDLRVLGVNIIAGRKSRDRWSSTSRTFHGRKRSTPS
jgi:hypothetical protein